MNRRQFLLAAAAAVGLGAAPRARAVAYPVSGKVTRRPRGDGFADVVIEGVMEFRRDVTADEARRALDRQRRNLCLPRPRLVLSETSVVMSKDGRRIKYRCVGIQTPGMPVFVARPKRPVYVRATGIVASLPDVLKRP